MGISFAPASSENSGNLQSPNQFLAGTIHKISLGPRFLAEATGLGHWDDGWFAFGKGLVQFIMMAIDWLYIILRKGE